MRLTIALMLSIFCAFSSARQAEGGGPGGAFSLVGSVTCEASTDKGATNVSVLLEYLPRGFFAATRASRSEQIGGTALLLNGYNRSDKIRISESKLIVTYDIGKGGELNTEIFRPFLVEFTELRKAEPRDIRFVGCESIESRFGFDVGKRVKTLQWQVSLSSPGTDSWYEKPVQCLMDVDPVTNSCHVKYFNANDGEHREYGMRKGNIHGPDVTSDKDGSKKETRYWWDGEDVTKAEYEKRLAQEQKAKKAG